MAQTSEMTQKEWARLPWCHIYGQSHWHAEAVIEATPAALTVLRDAIDAALKNGREADSDSLFTTDGEGYHVEVRVRNREYLERRPLPYTADFARGQ